MIMRAKGECHGPPWPFSDSFMQKGGRSSCGPDHHIRGSAYDDLWITECQEDTENNGRNCAPIVSVSEPPGAHLDLLRLLSLEEHDGDRS